MSELRHALNNILAVLKHQVDFDLWMITRTVNDDWIMLSTTDSSYGVKPDDVKVWSDSVCSRMVTGAGPNIVPNMKDVEAYAQAPIYGQIDFESYVGYPLKSSSGELLGTLCGIDPKPKSDDLEEQSALIQNFVVVVENLLRQSKEIDRLNTLLRDFTHSDPSTEVLGLPNQSAFMEFAESQKQRMNNTGTPLGIILIDIQHFAPEFQKPEERCDGLMAAKELLLSAKRDVDVLCKLNNDSFGMLMIDADNKMLTSQVVELLKLLRKHHFKVSVGAHVCRQQETIDQAVENAKQRRFG
ncbi:diguanylate cyclase domain-containing protein [Glaciecola siphonariae]|uniref:Diguanylate cyclase domain-containing protein n=1 Tax=Glaciecola siphonariae TaxID=521012 RepID=A0ABV9LUX4_9ALTE